MKQKTNLSAEQQEAIDKLNKLRVGALFMEPGTGKTRVSCELIQSTDADFILWIVPLRTKENLVAEIEKWGYTFNYKVVGVESISQSDRIYIELLGELENYKKIFCVVDESLKIKNMDAKRTQRVISIGNLCHYRLILNGTPITKNIMDLWSQLEFLSPKILKMNEREFKKTFVEYVTITKKDKVANRKSHKEMVVGFHNLEYLYSLIRPYVYDADLELNSKKEYIEVKYELSGDEFVAYNYLKEMWLDRVEKYWDNPNIFMAMLQDLHHSYCISEDKFIVLKNIIKKRGNEKTVVFCKFRKSVSAILERLPDAHVMTYGKSSLGLNLQNFNTIVFFDKTFDYMQRDQSEHRIYRTGQEDDCYFYDMTGDVNLEKTIDDNIMAKGNLLSSFKNVIMNNG